MKFLKFTLLSLLFLQFDISAQTLKRATGGDGLYKESILWLDFSSLELAAGDSITQTYVIDGLYSLVVTIDDISFSGTLYNNVDLADQRLVGYKSGNYGGDGLVKLYNIGVPNNGEEIHERYQNTLYNALSFKHAGSNKCNGEEAIGNFRIRAYAYLNGSTDPIDVGLVFASAETDEPIPYNDITCDEFSKGVTNGSPWQVLETGFYDPDGYQRVIIDDNGQTASTACGFNGFDWAIGNSIILYTKKLTTTLVNPLNVNMQFSGGGNTATAIGFLLTSVDKGDAPESYGLAENLFFSTVLGGTPPADGAYFISTEGEYGGPNVVETGMLGYSNVPRLGDIAGDPDDYSSISNSSANTDDYDGIADEDAIAQPIFVTTRDTAFSIQFNATNIPGYDAYVNAWFDANKNGTFDPAEFKNSTINTPTSISYTWDNVPTTVGSTYLRLRIQSNVAGDPSEPYDIRMGGETEDYMVKITSFITGNVFNDLNGVDNNSNIVDGNLISEIESSPLFISIIKNGDYIGQVPVAPDGSYEIGEIDEANYELILTTIENSTTPHLGSNWEYMGENIGDSSGHDGEKNGKIIVTIVNNSPEINEVNFGINKRPDTDSKHTTIPSPRTGDTLKIGINTLPGLTGSDFEDGDYANLNGESADPSGIRITTLPFNGVLYYDGTPVTVNQFIPSMEMGDLYIILTGTDYISTSFNYAYIDGAGLEDLSPATYTIEWSSLLPVSLKSFEAIALPEITLITWETASETNNKGFEVERSLDGINWDKLIFISTKSKNGFSNTPLTYSYSDDILNGEVYYRLKQIDYSGEIEYSHIRSITRENQMIAKIFPNPVTDDLRIEGIHNSKSIRIYSALGALVNSIQINNENELQLSMGKMPKGLYIVEITGNDNSINNYKLIKN